MYIFWCVRRCPSGIRIRCGWSASWPIKSIWSCPTINNVLWFVFFYIQSAIGLLTVVRFNINQNIWIWIIHFVQLHLHSVIRLNSEIYARPHRFFFASLIQDQRQPALSHTRMAGAKWHIFLLFVAFILSLSLCHKQTSEKKNTYISKATPEIKNITYNLCVALAFFWLLILISLHSIFFLCSL